LKGVDGPSSYYAFQEIFGKRNYEFASRTASPRIIDGGSNIGLALIFFKQLFPTARVTGFEPDPAVFAVLQENMRSFGLHDVELVNKALWTEDQRLEFHCDGADGGRLHRGHSQGQRLQVEACRLRSYLDEPVEMLKLDIEGAEWTCCWTAATGWARCGIALSSTTRSRASHSGSTSCSACCGKRVFACRFTRSSARPIRSSRGARRWKWIFRQTLRLTGNERPCHEAR
jgi:FkbM family methyltransferase